MPLFATRYGAAGGLDASDRPAIGSLTRSPESWIGYGVSLALHLVALLILAAWMLAPHWSGASLSIDAALSEADDSALMEGADFEVPVIVPADEKQDPASDPNTDPLDALSLAAAANKSARASLADSGGQVADQMIGQGGGANFFGAEGRGSSFVFIVDASGSMEGNRFKRAIKELNAAVARLSAGQSFFVIFYNDVALPMCWPKQEDKLVAATSENRTRIAKWTRTMEPVGGTMPEEAFAIALKLNPDVIFFLTDGEIPPETREEVRNANAGRVSIHTIALGIEKGAEILKGIAEDNHGRYRFVR